MGGVGYGDLAQTANRFIPKAKTISSWAEALRLEVIFGKSWD
jgi:hypothetical protein